MFTENTLELRLRKALLIKDNLELELSILESEMNIKKNNITLSLHDSEIEISEIRNLMKEDEDINS